jgi:hypothetical protein
VDHVGLPAHYHYPTLVIESEYMICMLETNKLYHHYKNSVLKANDIPLETTRIIVHNSMTIWENDMYFRDRDQDQNQN